jgi:glycosyltransferase involved in cell wall biosynthesis
VRFLLLSRSFPYDPAVSVYGVFKRLGMFVEAIKGLGSLDVLFFVRPGTEISPLSVSKSQERLSQEWGTPIRLALCLEEPGPPGRTRWDLYGRPALSYYRQPAGSPVAGSAQLDAFLASVKNGPDAILVHRLGAMSPIVRAGRDLPPVFFDLDDVEHVALVRTLRHLPHWRGRRLQYLQVPALMRAERRAIRSATRTFVCSDEDRRYLERVYRLPGIATIPNAVPLPPGFGPSATRTCLFLGRYTYTPNIDAAAFLLGEIWPRIRSAVPDARLLIVGERPEAIPRPDALASGVEFLGFVPDLDRLYARAQVVCAPIRSGSGTRIKIIEAAAYGKPVVATHLGAEGLAFRDGSELLLRDEPAAFARACVDVLLDGDMARRVGMAARAAVERLYARAAVVERIQAELRAGLTGPARFP